MRQMWPDHLFLIIISIISVKLGPMRKIEFWYSIGSTYTYLSTQRLAQIETENEVVKRGLIQKIFGGVGNARLPTN